MSTKKTNIQTSYELQVDIYLKELENRNFSTLPAPLKISLKRSRSAHSINRLFAWPGCGNSGRIFEKTSVSFLPHNENGRARLANLPSLSGTTNPATSSRASTPSFRLSYGKQFRWSQCSPMFQDEELPRRDLHRCRIQGAFFTIVFPETAL